MREIDAADAQTHFDQLLKEIERGEEIVITRRGSAIARLTPEPERRQAEFDD